jgi:hypothetical protein
MQGKLYQHCAEVEKQAQDMFDMLVEQTKENDGVTEQLKENDQMKWLGLMNNYRHCAEEVVLNSLIYN